MQYRYYLLLILLFSMGCRKYVDIKTQGTLVPGQLQNYRLLLDNSSNFEASAGVTDYASDDVQYVDGSAQWQGMLASDYYGWLPRTYTWQSVIYPLTGFYYQDPNWSFLYNTVTNANVIITEVPGVQDGMADQKSEMIAEALVHRADAYLGLVNTYAKPFNSATAATDPGVPLVLKETTTQSLVRNPVAEVYQQVLSDLRTALPALPVVQAYNMYPTKASAYGVMARCFLYMNRYDSASRYADSALSYRSALNDLGALGTITYANYPLRKSDPEILLSKIVSSYGVSAYAPTAMRLSDTLLSVLQPNDQRYILFTTGASTISSQYVAAGGRFFSKDRSLGEARNTGVSVPEMMLIKAEYYARTGDAAMAMEWVNKLRVKRYTAANYVALSASDADDALVKVIQERQREFFCRMLRWWDMRRLKSESRFQRTVTRVFGGVTYTLDPSGNRYVLPISPYNLKLNPEIQPNP
ncbi:MAG: RagB/SusD family nutrient uptake outer membrane protein [Bacteroidetes bacterium]|nr:RagB/SusD family nutrient uptake outer membrane protein [Bacteroidota bacterium]